MQQMRSLRQHSYDATTRLVSIRRVWRGYRVCMHSMRAGLATERQHRPWPRGGLLRRFSVSTAEMFAPISHSPTGIWHMVHPLDLTEPLCRTSKALNLTVARETLPNGVYYCEVCRKRERFAAVPNGEHQDG